MQVDVVTVGTLPPNQDPYLSPGSFSANTFNQVWDEVVQSSALVMQNMDPTDTIPPQMIVVTPSKNFIVIIWPSSSYRSLVEFLIALCSLLASGTPLNDISENSHGESLPGQKNTHTTSPACGSPGPLPSPHSVPTPKLNLPMNNPLPDNLHDIEVAKLFDASWTALPNGSTELCSCCENYVNFKKGLRAVGVSAGS